MFDWAKRLWDRFRNMGGARLDAPAAAIAPVPAAWQRYNGARPEPRGAPPNTVLALGGHELFGPGDFDALFEVVEALGIPADSLWTVIHHESHGRAAALNPEPAAGLIQLTTYAKLPGYETADKIRALIHQTAGEQLRGVVRQHYARSASVVRGMTPGELLLFNFTPKFVGRPESTVISSRGQAIYDKNYKAFDVDRKGTLTVGDVYRAAERITAEARGRRVARDGHIVEPGAAALGAASTARLLPAAAGPRSAKPAPASVAKPAPASTARPARVSKPAPAPAHKRAPAAPPADAEPTSEPPTLVSGAAGNPNLPARMDLVTAPLGGPIGDGGPVGIAGVRTLEAVQNVEPEKSDGVLDIARGALSLFSTGGGPLDAKSDPRGLLLSAAQAEVLDPVGWTWVPLPDEDLEVLVPDDAFKATLGDTPHVRIPVSYADLCAICRLLGCVPATREIVDAIYQHAQVHPKPVGLVQKAEDTARMNTVGFVLKYHAQLERQLQEAAAAMGLAALGEGTVIEPAGKWWILDPKMATSKYGAHAAVNYGWFRTSVRDPIQTPGGAHDDAHCDYSQLGRAVHRHARRASTQEQVDLFEVYAQKWPDLAPFIDVFR